MATTKITYTIPAYVAGKPAAGKNPLPQPADPSAEIMALISTSVVGNGGKLPTDKYAEKVAFGHTYRAGTYTDHKVAWVQALVWELRQTGASYREIAYWLGMQCSAITEAVTHGYARKSKVADGWQKDTGGRVAKLAKVEVTAGAQAS